MQRQADCTHSQHAALSCLRWLKHSIFPPDLNFAQSPNPASLNCCSLTHINLQVNAAEVGDEPLGEFLHVASLLVPLYAPRAWEVMEYGPDGASLATATPVADCFQIAYYCVRNSLLHPRWAVVWMHLCVWQLCCVGAAAGCRQHV
jgi:hypothetical protein